MIKVVLAAVFLFAIWVALTGAVGPVNIVTGVAVSVASVTVFRELIGGESWLGRGERLRSAEPRRRTARRSARTLFAAIALVPVFLWKVLLSGVNMAFLAFKPSIDFWPGIVRVEGGMNTVTGTALFANLLTLTPGTLTLDYDEQDDALYVHWIDVTGYGEDDFDSRVTSGLRKWMRRIEA